MRHLEQIRDLLYQPSEEAWVQLSLLASEPLEPAELAYLCDHLQGGQEAWRGVIALMPAPWFQPDRPAQVRAVQRALGWEGLPSWREVPLSLLLPGRFVLWSGGGARGAWQDSGAHGVSLTRGCAMMRVPMTQETWEAQAGFNPARFQPRNVASLPAEEADPSQTEVGEEVPEARDEAFADRPERALEQVLWWEAAWWCNERSRQAGRKECYRFTKPSGEPGGSYFTAERATFAGLDCLGWRMPTEAEWEYGCRAGSSEETWLGPLDPEDNAQLDAVAWYDHNAGGCAREVGRKEANPWGLHDMLGNVWEWCTDVYTAGPRQPKRDRVDPVGKGRGEGRVAKGGCWNSPKFVLRAGNRINFMPGGRNDFIGFRLARTVLLPAPS